MPPNRLERGTVKVQEVFLNPMDLAKRLICRLWVHSHIGLKPPSRYLGLQLFSFSKK